MQWFSGSSTRLTVVAVVGALLAGCGEPPARTATTGAATTETTASSSETTVYPGGEDTGDGMDASSSGYAGPELPLLLHRGTGDGISVWVRRWPGSYPIQHSATGWVPPAWCFPDGQVRVSYQYGQAVGESYVSSYAAPAHDAVATTVYGGYAEGTPLRIVVMQVATGVTQIGATWSDGVSDAATPQDGWVVLAAAGADTGEATFTVTDADGERAFTPDWSGEANAEWMTACMEPEYELPPPGEQPADAAAERQALRDRFDELWTPAVELVDKVDQYVSDTTGLVAALQAVFSGSSAELAATASHTMTEIVFVSPTEAWFRYHLGTSAGALPALFGHATKVDGRWMFDRAMVCQEVALVGVQCSPPGNSLLPPQG